MFERPSLAPCIVCLLIGAIPAEAQVKPDVLERGKSATALVEVVTEKGQATGSAFCIDASGLFVSNAHVVYGAGAGDRIQLVLDIGKRSQRTLQATPLWLDEELDLALLKVQPGRRPLVALALGRDADLKEGAEVTTFGFPFGKEIALDDNRYPEVSVNLSRTMTLRRERDRLATIKFDGQLNPGNSGGPVVGPAGKVVGVAVATVMGGGVNFAIPVGQLTLALARPGLQFLMPPLRRADRMRPVTWQFQAVPPWPSGKLPDGLTVVVTMTANVGEPRVYTGRPSGNGAFQVTLTPVPSDPDRKVVLSVQMSKTMVNAAIAEVKDVDLNIGPRLVRLSDLRMISFRPGPNDRSFVILHEGGGIEGPIRGLGTVQAQRDRKTITIDLTQTEKIEIQPRVDRYASTHIVDVLAELRIGATTIGTCHNRLDFLTKDNITARTTGGEFVTVRPNRPSPNEGFGGLVDDDDQVTIGGPLDVKVDAAPRGAVANLRPTTTTSTDSPASPRAAGDLPKDALLRTLPGAVSDVVMGGGGRYLLLVSKKPRKLAIFDVTKASVVKAVSLPSENVRIVAGARKFFVAFPDEELIQSWDFERLAPDDGFRSLPIKGQLKDLAMGSDSEGPLLAYWNPSKPGYAPQRLSFIDAGTLQALRVGPATSADCEVSPSRGSFSLGPGQWQLYAAPRGNVFALDGAWRPRTGLRGSTLERDSGRYAAISVRGGRIGVVGPLDPSPDFQRTKNRTRYVFKVQSSSPYYLLIHDAAPSAGTPGAPSKDQVGASIHSGGDGARLFTIPTLEEMNSPAGQDGLASGLAAEKRFHFIPDAKALITIPPGNDRLVLRRIDLDTAIAHAEDAIVILSPAAIDGWAGEPLRSRIEARSTKGKVQFSLVDGPQGLTVSPDGQIFWPAPEQPDGVAPKLVLSLRDPAGRSRSHEFVIRVQ